MRARVWGGMILLIMRATLRASKPPTTTKRPCGIATDTVYVWANHRSLGSSLVWGRDEGRDMGVGRREGRLPRSHLAHTACDEQDGASMSPPPAGRSTSTTARNRRIGIHRRGHPRCRPPGASTGTQQVRCFSSTTGTRSVHLAQVPSCRGLSQTPPRILYTSGREL